MCKFVQMNTRKIGTCDYMCKHIKCKIETISVCSAAGATAQIGFEFVMNASLTYSEVGSSVARAVKGDQVV